MVRYNVRRRHTYLPRHLHHRELAVSDQGVCDLELGRIEGGGTTTPAPARYRRGPPRCAAQLHLFRFELRHAREEVDCQSPGGCRRVDGFRQRLQSDLALGELVDDFEQVAEVPREPIEPVDAHRVARPRELQQLGQLDAIRLRTALRLGEYLARAGGPQRI